MKCPKCQYIGFDKGDRCRNCGYEFSLSPHSGELDLPLKTGDEALGPLSDLTLSDADGRGASPTHHDRLADVVPNAPHSRGDRSRAAGELPLFGGTPDDAPLVSVPAVPRAPVAVRKSTPALRPQPAARPADEPAADGNEPSPAPAAERTLRPAPESRADEARRADGVPPAPAGSRLAAAAIDFVLMLAIDAAVLYLTLVVAGLRPSDVAVLPVMPFIAFLGILNGGYMAGLTTAGGQSIGKMALGIKVVPSEPTVSGDRVPLGQAVVRSVGYLVSALPAGLGFVPAFVGSERRAVHDRLAHTRVVKA